MRPIHGAALLLIVTAAIYAPTLGYGYVYEDRNDEARLTRSTFSARAGNPARVLTELSFDLSHALTPGDALGDHTVNLAVHLLNTSLLLALAWLFLPPWGAVFAAALFAVHPLNVEAVAYVSSRSELLACSGVLLALLSASLGSPAGALVGVVFACLSKESAVMAWLVVPLWVFATRAAFPLRQFLTIAAGLVLIGGVVFLARVTHLGSAVWSFGLEASLIGRTSASVMGLLSLFAFPFGLTIDHDWMHVPQWAQALSVGVLVVFSGMSLAALQRGTHWFSLAWLTTMIWFAPRFVIPNVEGLHEHHFLIPSLFWALCVGAWLSRSPIHAEA